MNQRSIQRMGGQPRENRLRVLKRYAQRASPIEELREHYRYLRNREIAHHEDAVARGTTYHTPDEVQKNLRNLERSLGGRL